MQIFESATSVFSISKTLPQSLAMVEAPISFPPTDNLYTLTPFFEFQLPSALWNRKYPQRKRGNFVNIVLTQCDPHGP